jgi:mRNA interferase HicA
VKRRDLIRHLEAHGARLLREGAEHAVYVNPAAGRTTTVPRHGESNNHLARKIGRELKLPAPWRRER